MCEHRACCPVRRTGPVSAPCTPGAPFPAAPLQDPGPLPPTLPQGQGAGPMGPHLSHHNPLLQKGGVYPDRCPGAGGGWETSEGKPSPYADQAPGRGAPAPGLSQVGGCFEFANNGSIGRPGSCGAALTDAPAVWEPSLCPLGPTVASTSPPVPIPSSPLQMGSLTAHQ